jgi:glycosyltransferase involved in cell wall biosynthesis
MMPMPDPPATRPGPAPGICLNMIVKNESRVIRRCIDSAKPFISHWVIVDTGSTDGTQQIVEQALAGIPGELCQRPWKDFGHNRTEALDLARGKAEYTLVIDADEVLEARQGFRMPALVCDSYQIRTDYAGTSYPRTQLVRSALDWRYVGVLHEYVTCPDARTQGAIDGLVCVPYTDGARASDPDKYKKDAAVLEAALEAEPDNLRYAFYLGQSYRDAGELEEAIAAYERRIAMGGWEEEVWFSMFQVARLKERLGEPENVVTMSYLRAHQFRPERAEALCDLARYHRLAGKYALAYLFASAAHQTPRPGDTLFVDETVYAWRAADELSIAAYYRGEVRLALDLAQGLLASGRLPESERERVQSNVGWNTRALASAPGGQAPESGKKKRR